MIPFLFILFRATRACLLGPHPKPLPFDTRHEVSTCLIRTANDTAQGGRKECRRWLGADCAGSFLCKVMQAPMTSQRSVFSSSALATKKQQDVQIQAVVSQICAGGARSETPSPSPSQTSVKYKRWYPPTSIRLLASLPHTSTHSLHAEYATLTQGMETVTFSIPREYGYVL